MIQWHKIFALMWRDVRIVTRVKYRIIDIFYYPIVMTLIWGLFAQYTSTFAAQAGLIVLVINMFWSFATLGQQQANILMMEDIWSGSLKQILLSGIHEFEYLLARQFIGFLIATTMSVFVLGIASQFGLDVIALLPKLVPLILITLIGSMALAGLIASCIIWFGREYGFLSWSALQLFIFLSAPFYPVNIMPAWLQAIAQAMPFTRIFEAARALATNQAIPPALLWQALGIVLVYFVACYPLYWFAFHRARKNGVLARMSAG